METITTDTENGGHRMIHLTWENVYEAVRRTIQPYLSHKVKLKVYGVPRGGIHAAQACTTCYPESILLVNTPEQADIIIDDIIDSGDTMRQHELNYSKVFLALYRTDPDDDLWYVFPWEAMKKEDAPTDNIVRVLQYIGEDPKREGLLETPARVVKSWAGLYGGYRQSVEDVLKIFEEDSSDEMVVLKDIEFYSTCEHHMLPFFGKAHIAYIPDGKVVGISKLARILEVYSRRLQIQERLSQQVVAALMHHLSPQGAACVLEAKHFCMTARGVQKQNSVMVTSDLQGAFRQPETRAEFFNIIRG